VMEEPNKTDIIKLLKSLPDNLNAVERMIMTNEGTVQTLLSVLCRTPVKVEVISQREMDDVIIRWSKLVAVYPGDREVTVCLAESVIPLSNTPGFITMVNNRELGIGQIIKSTGMETGRSIKGFHADDNMFARAYSIAGDCRMVITEVFNRETIATIAGVKREGVWVTKAAKVVDLSELAGWTPEGYKLYFGHSPPHIISKEDNIRFCAAAGISPLQPHRFGEHKDSKDVGE